MGLCVGPGEEEGAWPTDAVRGTGVGMGETVAVAVAEDADNAPWLLPIRLPAGDANDAGEADDTGDAEGGNGALESRSRWPPAR